MSTCRQLWQLTGVVASLALATLCVAEEATGRLATYDKAPGESFFALSVMPKVAADAAQTNEIVVLFDTSASQAGAVRDEALVALDALLKGGYDTMMDANLKVGAHVLEITVLQNNREKITQRIEFTKTVAKNILGVQLIERPGVGEMPLKLVEWSQHD